MGLQSAFQYSNLLQKVLPLPSHLLHFPFHPPRRLLQSLHRPPLHLVEVRAKLVRLLRALTFQESPHQVAGFGEDHLVAGLYDDGARVHPQVVLGREQVQSVPESHRVGFGAPEVNPDVDVELAPSRFGHVVRRPVESPDRVAEALVEPELDFPDER